MIQSVSTAEDKTEYLRRLSGKPYFEAVLGTHLHLFGNHPASGWAFYLLPGSAVLELRGGSAVLCGALPGGEAGEDAREELTGFLRFLHADTLRTEHPLTLPGWRPAAPLTLWELPKGRALPLPPAPPGGACPGQSAVDAAGQPPCLAESDAEADEFYSAACTALGPVGWAPAARCCTTADLSARVGCYEQSDTESYMAGGRDRPRVARARGRGAVFDLGGGGGGGGGGAGE